MRCNLINEKLIAINKVSDNLLSNLESRDAVLWIRSLPKDPSSQNAVIDFLELPWQLIISEISDPELVKKLEDRASFNDPMTRKRGFIQIIDTDPTRIEFPQRCLPIYLLNGREIFSDSQSFENRLRRMTMLESLRRIGAREILVLSDDVDPVPPDLKDLWSSGFRSYITFASNATDADCILRDWVKKADGITAVNFLHLPSIQIIEDILARYAKTYPEDRRIIRMRDRLGNLHKIDITELDEPERPILQFYSVIEERDITPILEEELLEDDFISFFKNPESSWRPYASYLPWFRNDQPKTLLRGCLKKLDIIGSEENCIAYIASESGAGGTTLARMLAWEAARDGYPVLLAKPVSFLPDALPIVNFLHRVLTKAESIIAHDLERSDRSHDVTQNTKKEPVPRRYETPWVVVFDTLHWHNRTSDLLHFRNELEKSGRPVCVLIVSGPILGLPFYNTAIFKEIATLNHAITQEEAQKLGRHLNRFLRCYGKERQDSQWDEFYHAHTTRYLDGVAAFWVTLSFWIQGQYDLTESIQQWIYRTFKENVDNEIIQKAILEIAALSSERIPLPEALLPESNGSWPISHLLEDSRASLATLGLMHISANGEKCWALIHDILGRFLINALFYDFPMREKFGFSNAQNTEHLRFLLLRQISQKAVLGERAYRSIGEDFAMSIFKIDPDHGYGNFATIWNEVLDALDHMPQSLRDTSRVFRHHTAVSRRRIAKFDEKYYNVKNEDKINLLNQAVEDINYALQFIEYTPGSEPNFLLFTSLANAYLDLAEVESLEGSPQQRIVELRQLANDATRRVYEENPMDSFVIETYVKNLLTNEPDSKELVIQQCVEALGILFSALNSNDDAYRKPQLGDLADRALNILFQQVPETFQNREPNSAIDVLINAWMALMERTDYREKTALTDIPEANRTRALEILSHPTGRGNMQVIRLCYDLICIDHPYAFKDQLELVEQLQATNYRMTPQLKLEYAILLFQNNRAVEGDGIFKSLRRLWHESEHFVQVPERLRWLRTLDGYNLQTVHAITGSDVGTRVLALVQEFSQARVPFRPEEFGIRDVKTGLRLACHVSFGHKGPFLRPVTAHPTKVD